VIVVGYVGVALVIGVGATLLAVVAGRAVGLPFIVAGNACVLLMLCGTRSSISRLWSTVARTESECS